MNQHLPKSIVQILLRNGTINGPGFFVSGEGHILTCYHTVHRAIWNDVVNVGLPDGSFVQAKVISGADAHEEDIALLKVDLTPEVVLNLRPFPPHLTGKDFVTFGYPEKMSGGMYGYGQFGDKTPKGWLQLSSREVREGFSGGPVVISDAIDVVGVVKNQYCDGKEIVAQFCIPGETVLRFFPDLKARYQIYESEDLHNTSVWSFIMRIEKMISKTFR
jgi:S1-C subfamily serine protease